MRTHQKRYNNYVPKDVLQPTGNAEKNKAYDSAENVFIPARYGYIGSYLYLSNDHKKVYIKTNDNNETK